ncbi:transcription factor SPEECHLESS-like isoform X2 [Andrographis paniculata]|uniref:transcription factor SPEECHLESS-like isoform X2 n=1 Tax=Andrographis paniculata TaxID=175694 RepID=UPI0021E90289|nr:transcription factor SPEECHLESS-like isoform X2 [Andrographis paniculata]
MDDLFSVLQAWESNIAPAVKPCTSTQLDHEFEFHKSNSSSSEPPKCCRKPSATETATSMEELGGAPHRMSHITVERNRRKQMNEHLAVLRSLMPCFYVKRGDQASIIGGVVDYIQELQQILHSLEAKKQRKVVYSEAVVISPRPVPSPLSPRGMMPPLSPRLMSLPISPRTPQPTSPYRPPPAAGGGYHLNSPTTLKIPRPMMEMEVQPSPGHSSTNEHYDAAAAAVVNELVATSKSAVAEVEVKFAGPNLVVKTVSHRRMPGQAARIVSALEQLALEILHLKITILDHQTMLNLFTIKVGIECQLSAEELAQKIQHTFC